MSHICPGEVSVFSEKFYMARYGKRFRSKRGFKKRYRKKFGRMRFRKMGSSKVRLYRQGGNFAQNPGRPSIELKSLDGFAVNVLVKSGGVATSYSGDTAANAWMSDWVGQIGSGIGAPATFQYHGSLLAGGVQGRAQPLNLTIVGNQLQNRLGRKIQMRSVKINMNLRPPTTSAGFVIDSNRFNPSALQVNTAPTIRLILVYDRQSNGAAVQYADVLASPGGSGVGASTHYVGVTSSNNLNNRSRFLTIFDKTYTLGNADIGGKHVQIYKKLNLPVIYNVGAPADCYDPGQIQTGGLLLMAVSENNAMAATVGASGSYEISAATATNTLQILTPWALMPSYRIRFTDA